LWGHPGKKLLFMGQEFGQITEWNHDTELTWHVLDDPGHAGLQRWVRDLNQFYRATRAMHVNDAQADGFEWLEGGDADQSVIAWVRHGRDGDAPVVMVVNFTPVDRPAYRIGLPRAGAWREALNSDAGTYGGENRGNMGRIMADTTPSHGKPASAAIYLPPLSTLFLIPDD
jgi:1,4-alpha-glucan branching enzyme